MGKKKKGNAAPPKPLIPPEMAAFIETLRDGPVHYRIEDKTAAAEALGAFASECDIQRSDLAKGGAIAPLVEALDGTALLAEQAAYALRHLAFK